MCKHHAVLYREPERLQILVSKGDPGSSSQGGKGQPDIACHLSLLCFSSSSIMVSVFFVTVVSFIPRTLLSQALPSLSSIPGDF